MTGTPITTAAQRRLLRHQVTWRPQTDSVRSDPPIASDGKDPSSILPVTLFVLLEPKSAGWMAQRYGVEVQKQSYVVVGPVDELRPMEKGDEIAFGDTTLTVFARATILPPGDRFGLAEITATETTGGGRR